MIMLGVEINEGLLNLGRLAIIIIVLSVIVSIVVMIFAIVKRTVIGKPSIPNDFDEEADKIVEAAKSGLLKLKKSIDSLKSRKSHVNNISEKIRLLGELEQLKFNGSVSDEEYYSLRDEIMK